MKKAILFTFLITIMYGCGSNDRGELVGVKIKNKWFSEKPFGMVSIPAGSFTKNIFLADFYRRRIK